MDSKNGKLTKNYELDKIDDLLRELDNSKIRINALIDYNLKLERVNNEQANKNLLSHEFKRLSPIIELLNTEVFDSIQKAMTILESESKDSKLIKVSEKK